jgi:hypothetical protein
LLAPYRLLHDRKLSGDHVLAQLDNIASKQHQRRWKTADAAQKVVSEATCIDSAALWARINHVRIDETLNALGRHLRPDVQVPRLQQLASDQCSTNSNACGPLSTMSAVRTTIRTLALSTAGSLHSMSRALRGEILRQYRLRQNRLQVSCSRAPDQNILPSLKLGNASMLHDGSVAPLSWMCHRPAGTVDLNPLACATDPAPAVVPQQPVPLKAPTAPLRGCSVWWHHCRHICILPHSPSCTASCTRYVLHYLWHSGLPDLPLPRR